MSSTSLNKLVNIHNYSYLYIHQHVNIYLYVCVHHHFNLHVFKCAILPLAESHSTAEMIDVSLSDCESLFLDQKITAGGEWQGDVGNQGWEDGVSSKEFSCKWVQVEIFEKENMNGYVETVTVNNWLQCQLYVNFVVFWKKQYYRNRKKAS